jgi:hypothetical protein
MYNSPEKYALKYKAIKARGVRALGMWTADSARGDATVAAAPWAALPSLIVHP